MAQKRTCRQRSWAMRVQERCSTSGAPGCLRLLRLLSCRRVPFPQTQQGNADLIETLAQQKLGMPVPDALALLTGEFASMQTSPSMDSTKQVYFFGIRNKPETLKLMRTVLSEQLTSERNEGEITFLKISLGGKQSGAGSAQWNFFNLAVTQ